MLGDLFGLTRAEADVAIAAALGVSAEGIAAQRGVGLATIRTQLRAVLSKTGAGSLRVLGQLLGSLPPG